MLESSVGGVAGNVMPAILKGENSKPIMRARKLMLANCPYKAEAIKEFSRLEVKVLYPPVLFTFFY